MERSESDTPATERRFRSMNRRLINVILFAGASGLALLVAEIGVRLLRPQQLVLIRPDIWEPIDTLGWKRQANVRTRVNMGEGPVLLFTDEYGYRVGESGRRNGSYRILLIGDSFVEALQVDHEQSLAGRLEVALEKTLGEPVAVRNAGVGGWNPNHYLLQLRRSLSQEPAELVIVCVFLGNDIIRDPTDYYPPRTLAKRHAFRIPRALKWREIVDALFYPVNDYFEVRSHLFILAKTSLSNSLMRIGLTASYFPPHFLKAESTGPWWDLTVRVLSDIAEFATDQGTPTLFVLIPASYQMDERVFRQHTAAFGIDSTAVDQLQPNRLLSDRLNDAGLIYSDLTQGFREAARAGKALYGTVDLHFTAVGHDLATQIVAPVATNLLRTP